ncbi:MAG: KilA-N domain-containing protein [Brevinematales bacterium]
MEKIDVIGNEITIITKEQKAYISLTDIAKYKNSESPADIVKNWMRSRSTIDFLGLWENLNNPDFKLVEFDQFKSEAGANYFVLSPQKWIQTTNAIGIISKSGKNGGTFAHKDIAFEFASWVSSEFKLYLIKEFQRLKDDENNRLKLDWNLQRTISKINYRIHTDAIKENLIPPELSKNQTLLIYANEADILNMALFGRTAKEWRDKNPDKEGNIRDEATLEQLVVLSNLESINSVLIHQGISQSDRLMQLNKIAITQMKSLVQNSNMKKLN